MRLIIWYCSNSGNPYPLTHMESSSLGSWSTCTHFCDWHGITRDPMLLRVTELNLGGYESKGTIFTHIGNLSYARDLILTKQFLWKNPTIIGKLLQLQYLFIRNNLLVGKIPANLTGCTALEHLHLYGNNLSGKIPIKIGSLRNLQYLNAPNNHFTGRIPTFIGNLSSLTQLLVSSNNFQGDIPQEICNLKSLTAISLSINNLSGTFHFLVLIICHLLLESQLQ